MCGSKLCGGLYGGCSSRLCDGLYGGCSGLNKGCGAGAWGRCDGRLCNGRRGGFSDRNGRDSSPREARIIKLCPPVHVVDKVATAGIREALLPAGRKSTQLFLTAVSRSIRG